MKNSEKMNENEKKELYIHLLITKNFMNNVYSSKKAFACNNS